MPGDFIIFRDSVIPNAVSAFVQEPSTSANGKNVFQVGNWYAARSFDNGATWNFLDPFSIFGPDFCCDQVTIYDPGRDRQFWLLQYGDHLAIANSSGTDLFTNWCVYNIDPTWIGQPATTALDYNDLALGTNYLYLTTNIFPAAGGAGSAILRLPIDALITCGAFGYNYTVHMDSFTFKPVQGAQDVMYWGSNWGQLNGQSFRVYSWAENSGTYFWFDRTIDAFTFMFRNSGQYCGSADGLVTNWCQFADSRVLSGYRANGILGFSFNVSQGSGFPFPYSRRVYFRESDIAYLGATALWAEWSAIQYLQLTPNARGHIGGVFAWGGGTTTNFYPGTGLLIDDDVSPVQPWAVAFPLFGGGNTCTFDGLSRWGDYLTVQRFHPVGNAWVAAGFAIQGAHCGTTDPAGNPLWYSEPHNYIFGRGRDSGSVDRWWDT